MEHRGSGVPGDWGWGWRLAGWLAGVWLVLGSLETRAPVACSPGVWLAGYLADWLAGWLAVWLAPVCG